MFINELFLWYENTTNSIPGEFFFRISFKKTYRIEKLLLFSTKKKLRKVVNKNKSKKHHRVSENKPIFEKTFPKNWRELFRQVSRLLTQI